MNTTPRAMTSFTIIGSILAILLQLMLAPSVAILGIAPNFLLCFVLVNAMFSHEIRATLVGFILGLAYDLIALGALGSMTIVFILIAYGVSSLNKEAISISWTVQSFFFLICVFIGELLYAAILSIIGYDSNFLASIGLRVVPITLYSGLIGLVVFFVMSRFNKKRRPEIIRSKLK